MCIRDRLKVTLAYIGVRRMCGSAICVPCYRGQTAAVFMMVPRLRLTCLIGHSLDNVCAEPSPSDCRYLEGLHRTYAHHQDFPRTQPRNMVRSGEYTCEYVST